ncbi:helix-turn-helix transcriptional regulator [Streptomyces tateyamensis]|uniref:Helix-turn-helix transcriptional regulator n=1 Tax=Streptomyces tateyamensis TaxID=565073 RepID=A0A2V4NUZ6_9ACTN|nr:LuxR family transcriptional regulator [Streptomyces tateyamensis]PYC85057.1 helix-turn-helix transcriptional regulator [Streptomyces tateyamensis]
MLYGRARERAAVARLLAEAAGGRSGVLVLRGEPGIGKSALLRDAAEQAGERFRVLRASGVESEADLPFAGLHLLLAPALDRLAALPGPQRRALEVAFGLAEPAPGGAGGSADRLLAGLAVLGLLAELAAERPLLCLVDDAHWLDRSSADALLLAARRLEREGVVLLCAARDGDGAFAAAGLAELRPAPLEPAAAAELLGEVLGERLAGPERAGLRYRVLVEAQGNPLALTELPGALDGAAPVGELALTERLRQALLGQVDRLTPGARTLLLAVAAQDRGRVTALLAAGAKLGFGEAELAAVVAAGPVRRDGPEELAFRHPLLRRAVLDAALPEQLRAVHRVLGVGLRREGDQERGDWHLAQAAEGPDEELALALERAGRRAGARAGHAGAVAAFERAAALSPDRTARAGRLLLAAEAAVDAAQADRATELAARAAELADDPVQWAVLDWVAATAAFWRGDCPEAHRLLLRAAGRRMAPPLAARALLPAFHAAWYLGEEQAAEVLDRLAALQLPADDAVVPLVAQLTGAVRPVLGVSVGESAPRRADRAPGSLAEAARLARAAGAESPRELVQLCGVGLVDGRDAQTLALAVELVEEARTAGAVGVLPTLLFFLAEAELFHGRHRAAELAAAEGLGLAGDLGQPQWESQLAALDAYLAALRGDGRRLRERVDQATAETAWARGTRWAAGTSWTQWALAADDLAQGRAAEVVDRLAAHTAGPHRHHVSAVRTVPDLVEAAVRLGRPERAEAAFERFARWSERCGEPAWSRALVLRCQALLGPPELVESAYLAALELHRQADRPFELARTELLFGEWLRRGKRRAEAGGRLRAAAEVFDRLGAVPWAERARTELAAAGGTVPAAQSAGPLAGLTPQEEQIARLAARGLSNREIAAQLFLSPRTVGHHLYKAYPKLGISSRGELAGLVG